MSAGHARKNLFQLVDSYAEGDGGEGGCLNIGHGWLDRETIADRLDELGLLPIGEKHMSFQSQQTVAELFNGPDELLAIHGRC